jgi:UDP-glucose 4-epimerase
VPILCRILPATTPFFYHPCISALSKSFGEQLCDAAVTRSDIKIISIRPSWCQDADNIERNLGPLVRDFNAPNAGLLAYIPIKDLATAITLAALNTTLPGHEIFYIAAPDSAGGHNLAEWVKAKYGDKIPVRDLPFPDASSLCCDKAVKLLGWKPTLSWKSFLGKDGKLLASNKQ